jgi:siroheme synthase-like protein
MMDAGESDANMICCFCEVTEIQALVQLRCQHNSRKGVIQTLAQFSHREPRLTMQHFPIFVVLHVVPPLIIGDAPALAAIKGWPLVTLDCEDESLNRFLVATARAYVVPVNLPDNRALLGFYLGAIIDHAPVIIGVSTSGLAPVLGQALRSRLETMLPRNYGRLGNYGRLAHFLADLRCRLSALKPARRRRFQYDMNNGPAARHMLAGHLQFAGACADAALRHEAPARSPENHTCRVWQRRRGTVASPSNKGAPPSFPVYSGQPAVAARLTSPAAGSSVAIVMASFFTNFLVRPLTNCPPGPIFRASCFWHS